MLEVLRELTNGETLICPACRRKFDLSGTGSLGTIRTYEPEKVIPYAVCVTCHTVIKEDQEMQKRFGVLVHQFFAS